MKHQGKFQDGDKVRFSTTCRQGHRPPLYAIDLLKKMSRTVRRSYYDIKKQCRYYVLAGQGKGEIGYHFRSYELDLAPDVISRGRPQVREAR